MLPFSSSPSISPTLPPPSLPAAPVAGLTLPVLLPQPEDLLPALFDPLLQLLGVTNMETQAAKVGASLLR